MCGQTVGKPLSEAKASVVLARMRGKRLQGPWLLGIEQFVIEKFYSRNIPKTPLFLMHLDIQTMMQKKTEVLDMQVAIESDALFIFEFSRQKLIRRDTSNSNK